MGSWVVLPEPVSPAITTTWCSLTRLGDLVAQLADRQVGIGDRGDRGGARRNQGLGRGDLLGELVRSGAAEVLEATAEPGGVADRQAVKPLAELGD